MRLAKDVADDLWEQASNARSSDVSELFQFATRTASKPRLSAMIDLIASEPGIPIQPDELDSDPWLFNCPNGTVDLRDGKLHPHLQENLITKLSPTPFIHDSTNYRWNRFLESIFDGNGELIDFVQWLLGYCLTGSVREQLLPVFWGDGSNGKSTLLTAFMDIVGSNYAMQAVTNLLMVKRGDNHPTEQADLFGRRFIACLESEDGRRLDESTVKQLTGGDKIRALRMREDF